MLGQSLWLGFIERASLSGGAMKRLIREDGISGMKAAFNGVPSLSVLDGWWIEVCIEGVTGWAIGDLSGIPDDNARALYKNWNMWCCRFTTDTATIQGAGSK
jgi:hypothetical protein